MKKLLPGIIVTLLAQIFIIGVLAVAQTISLGTLPAIARPIVQLQPIPLNAAKTTAAFNVINAKFPPPANTTTVIFLISMNPDGVTSTVLPSVQPTAPVTTQ